MEFDHASGRRSARALLCDSEGRRDIKSMNRVELVAWMMEHCGATEGQALGTYKSLWQRGSRTFEELHNVAAPLRKTLAKRAYISFLEPELVLRSSDGTTKFLWKLEDGLSMESVLIPDGDRLTLCMSSQVGCSMACTFCLTGDLGLKRHLKASEIANQALQVGRQLPEGVRITNLVLMGMGEPLHNLDRLVRALEICLDDQAMNFSHRKVTVSTVGLVPRMGELAARLPVNLAVSLNASSEAQRMQIMPITRRYGLDELLEECRRFPLPTGKRITFEYVMLGGFNDTVEDAERLVGLLDGIPSKVNLIPYNENPQRTLKRPTDEAVKAFQHTLVQRHLNATVRVSRGRDISAACGQLGKAAQQAADRGWLNQARDIAGLAPSVT